MPTLDFASPFFFFRIRQIKFVREADNLLLSIVARPYENDSVIKNYAIVLFIRYGDVNKYLLMNENRAKKKKKHADCSATSGE